MTDSKKNTGFVEISDQGLITGISKIVWEKLNVSPNLIIGKPVSKFIHDYTQDAFHSYIAKAKAGYLISHPFVMSYKGNLFNIHGVFSSSYPYNNPYGGVKVKLFNIKKL